MPNYGLKTIKIFPINEVLPFVHEGRKTYFVNGKEYSVKIGNLAVFQKSIKCCCCGLIGEYIALQFHKNGSLDERTPHFNLYGRRNGQPIILTKDHIIPQSKGGTNQLDNLQPMCYDCNQTKKDYEITTDALKILLYYRKFLLSQKYTRKIRNMLLERKVDELQKED